MLLYDNKAGKLKTFNVDEAMNLYLRLAMYSHNHGDMEVYNMFEDNIENAYELLSANDNGLNIVTSKLEWLMLKHGIVLREPVIKFV